MGGRRRNLRNHGRKESTPTGRAPRERIATALLTCVPASPRIHSEAMPPERAKARTRLRSSRQRAKSRALKLERSPLRRLPLDERRASQSRRRSRHASGERTSSVPVWGSAVDWDVSSYGVNLQRVPANRGNAGSCGTACVRGPLTPTGMDSHATRSADFVCGHSLQTDFGRFGQHVIQLTDFERLG